MSQWRSVMLAFVAVPIGLVAGTVVAIVLSGSSADMEVFGTFEVGSIRLAVFVAGGFILGPWIALRVAGFRGAGATSALAVVLFIIGTTILNSVIYGDLGSSIPSWAIAVLALACAPLARVVVELGLRSSVESSSSTAIGSAAAAAAAAEGNARRSPFRHWYGAPLRTRRCYRRHRCRAWSGVCAHCGFSDGRLWRRIHRHGDRRGRRAHWHGDRNGYRPQSLVAER